MAIGTSFKRRSESCEAMVPVRDASLVGKKIECPKCKDKFMVQAPAAKKGEGQGRGPEGQAECGRQAGPWKKAGQAWG